MINNVAYTAFIKSAENLLEKTAMGIPSLNAIKPIAGGLARSAMGGAKNLLKQNWNSMGTFDKALTVGLPLATTGATMFNKKDQMGRSRAERLATMGGNIAGGMMGMQLGNNLTKGLGSGRLAGAAKFLGSTAGAIGGSVLGERVTAAPFNTFKKAPSQPTQGYAMNTNMQSPQVPNPGALT